MVSSGSVNSDLSSIKSLLSSYSSQISGLDGSWRGTSHDSIISKAEAFVSEYTSAIDSGMSAFASACDKYEEYKSYKDALKVAQSNLSQANSLNDSGAQSTYSNQVSEYTEKMNSLKSEIESLLSTASSNKLTATSISGGVSGASGGASVMSVSGGVQGAIDWALNTAADDSVGYSQNTRWGNPNYDCSSFVITAYQSAGIPVKDNGATYTGNMRNAFVNSGFEWIPGNPNVSDLQPGDVLLDEDSHTEMYIGNGQNVGAHSNKDGVDGDSSGKEVCVGNYYDHPWDGVLRYSGTSTL